MRHLNICSFNCLIVISFFVFLFFYYGEGDALAWEVSVDLSLYNLFNFLFSYVALIAGGYFFIKIYRLVKPDEKQSGSYFVKNIRHSRKDREFIKRFEGFIENNYNNPYLRRDEAAQALFITERHLNRKLSSLFEYNFAEYLKKYRLGKSKELILKGERIADVADMVGFNSQNYFSKCFKVEFGLAPLSFYSINNGKQEASVD